MKKTLIDCILRSYLVAVIGCGVQPSTITAPADTSTAILGNSIEKPADEEEAILKVDPATASSYMLIAQGLKDINDAKKGLSTATSPAEEAESLALLKSGLEKVNRGKTALNSGSESATVAASLQKIDSGLAGIQSYLDAESAPEISAAQKTDIIAVAWMRWLGFPGFIGFW